MEGIGNDCQGREDNWELRDLPPVNKIGDA